MRYQKGAIAWSYADCLHPGLPTGVLFHEENYESGARWLGETFAGGSYIGLPVLQCKGMAVGVRERAHPAILRWFYRG